MSGEPIAFDLRSGASSLAQFDFGLCWCSFGGSEVEWWWKLNDLLDRSFLDVWLRFGAENWRFNFEECSLGLSRDDVGVGYCFYNGRFRESVCLRW
jgi:hypothetical protein